MCDQLRLAAVEKREKAEEKVKNGASVSGAGDKTSWLATSVRTIHWRVHS